MAVRFGAKPGVLVALLAFSAVPHVALASAASSTALREAGTALDQGDYAVALRLIRPLADEGEPLAEYALGGMYAHGFGVPQNYPEAMKWLHTAAAKGIAAAQYELGFMYENGQGVAQDFTQAAYWYEQAAERGDDSSEVNLGYLYENGKGVARDLVQAYKWYHLAAIAKGNPIAQSCQLIRDALAARMTAKQIEEAKRLAAMVQPN
jgi:TPR repeat protein